MTEIRECGGCTACCLTHGIEELDKSPWTLCSLCKIGAGCSVYAKRPNECIEYTCLWRIGAFTENERPDCSYLVVDEFIHPDLNRLIICMHEVVIGALSTSFAQKVFNKSVRAELPILQVPFGGGKRVLFLPQNIELTSKMKAGLLKSGVQFIRRYGITTRAPA